MDGNINIFVMCLFHITRLYFYIFIIITFNIVVYDVLPKIAEKLQTLDGIFETLKQIVTLAKVFLSQTLGKALNNMKVWHFRIHHPN